MTAPTTTPAASAPARGPTAPSSARLLTAGPPLAAPAATPTAIVLALLVVAIGVVAARDVLVLIGVLGGTAWLTPLLTMPFVVRRDSAVLLPVGIAVAALGLILLAVAVKPRRRTHRPLAADGLWLRTRDVGTLITATAKAIPGVDAAQCTGSARRRRLRITPNLSAAADSAALRRDVDAAVTAALRVLAQPPTLVTTLRKAPRS